MAIPEKNHQEKETGESILDKDVSEVKDLKAKIEQLESELREEYPSDEQKKESTIKQEIKTYLHGLQQTPSFAAPTITRDEADEIVEFPLDQQVGALISLAFDKGVKKAVSIARKINNPAVLDEFHSALIDRCHKEFIEKK